MKKASMWCVILLCAFVSAKTNAGYRSELRRMTEHGVLYDPTTLDAKLDWRATLVSDDFRRARSQKHIELHHLNPLAAARWVADEEVKQSEGWEFFIALYTKSDYRQLSHRSDSFWKAVLVTSSGEEVEPTNVEMVPITPYERELYPYLSRWSYGYRIFFPKVDLGQRPHFTLRSVVGSSTLKWRLR